jgi:hypothetical protein
LLLKPTGDKLWRWKCCLQGKENLFAIGGFPQVNLAKPRATREKARALIKRGIHPSHARQQVKQRNLEALKGRTGLSGSLALCLRLIALRATYNKALLLDQRRTLLQNWANYLSTAEGSFTA